MHSRALAERRNHYDNSSTNTQLHDQIESYYPANKAFIDGLLHNDRNCDAPSGTHQRQKEREQQAFAKGGSFLNALSYGVNCSTPLHALCDVVNHGHGCDISLGAPRSCSNALMS